MYGAENLRAGAQKNAQRTRHFSPANRSVRGFRNYCRPCLNENLDADLCVIPARGVPVSPSKELQIPRFARDEKSEAWREGCQSQGEREYPLEEIWIFN
jgi:hypothetical protein